MESTMNPSISFVLSTVADASPILKRSPHMKLKPSMFAGVGSIPSHTSSAIEHDRLSNDPSIQILTKHTPADLEKITATLMEGEPGNPDLGRLGKAYSSSHIGDIFVSEFETYGARYKSAENEFRKLQIQTKGLLNVLDQMTWRYSSFGGSTEAEAYVKMAPSGKRVDSKTTSTKSDRGKGGSIAKQRVIEERAWWRMKIGRKMVGYRHVPYEIKGMKWKTRKREDKVKYERELLKMAMSEVADAMKEVQALEEDVVPENRAALSAVPFRVKRMVGEELALSSRKMMNMM